MVTPRVGRNKLEHSQQRAAKVLPAGDVVEQLGAELDPVILKRHSVVQVASTGVLGRAFKPSECEPVRAFVTDATRGEAFCGRALPDSFASNKDRLRSHPTCVIDIIAEQLESYYRQEGKERPEEEEHVYNSVERPSQGPELLTHLGDFV